jgi:hypothetical protein
VLQKSLVIIYWNCKINKIKKVKYDKRIKDKNTSNDKPFSFYVCPAKKH